MQRAIKDATFQHLRTSLHGELVCPGDEGYDQARRVWNGRVDRYPSLIVYCADTTDILRCIEFARHYDMEVAVRSGGHSLADHSVCNDGLVIDLSRMKDMRVDPMRGIAHAQAGLTLAEFVFQTQQYGLATTTGTVAGTGLGGLTTGGGIGWLMGRYGLTIDNLLSADIVTADGQVLMTSATKHADLFWGLRGGGGNFGVVTSFSFQLHPVRSVLAGKIVYPLAKARDVLRLYREYTSTAPDELTAYVSITNTLHNIPTIAISLCYRGPLALGEHLVEPLRKFGSPLADSVCAKPYIRTISNDAGAPAGRHYDQRSVSLYELSDEEIDIIAAFAASRTSPYSQVLIQHVHGAARRVRPTATAFALRDIPYVMNMVAAWNANETHDAEKHVEWVRAFQAALHPFTARGVYSNFLSDEGEERVRASYGMNYEKLVSLKNRYDPTNFFHLNQNIKPTL